MIKTKEQNKKGLSALFWLLTVLCLGFIFYMSAQPAEESSAMSNWVLLLLERLLGTELTDFIVRKLAHFLEFAGLSLLFNCALFYSRGRRHFYTLATGLTSLYAATDELHQLFVPGRACQLRDWGIDTLGALFGTLLFYLILLLGSQLKKRRTASEVSA